MRDDSLYPTWRKIVGLFTWIWYLTAIAVLISSVMTTKTSMLAILPGIGAAAAIALFAKVWKELSLMLADLSDATVRLAAAKEDRHENR